MPDPVPPPPAPAPAPALPPAPTWLHRLCTALLPQFIAYSRKGMIWFCALGGSGIAELAKQAGDLFGWSPERTLHFSNEMLLFQGLLITAAKFWTDQIAREDQALKTGLPPPSQNVAGGNITVQSAQPANPAPQATGERS